MHENFSASQSTSNTESLKFGFQNNKKILLCGALYLGLLLYRVDLEQWVQVVQRLLTSCKEACAWLVELLASPEGTGYLKYASLSSDAVVIATTWSYVSV